MSQKKVIEIYTDGSCHTQQKIGAWAAILFIYEEEEITLKGIATATTHNRMELTAVIKAFEYLQNKQVNYEKAIVYSDSQYVVNLIDRKNNIKRNDFLTNKGTPIPNKDLLQKLITILESYPVDLQKVLSHQKQTDTINYNREVDKLARKLVRKAVNKIDEFF